MFETFPKELHVVTYSGTTFHITLVVLSLDLHPPAPLPRIGSHPSFRFEATWSAIFSSLMAPPSLLTYAERLHTFDGYWDDCQTTARQLAAIGHVCDRPPIEALEEGSRCVSCSAFVRRDLSVKALGDAATASSYEENFESFNFHHPHCVRLSVKIPLDPQALLPGLHGYRLDSIRSKFERRAMTNNVSNTMSRLPQSSSLFSLPTEIRLEIYAMVLPALDVETEIVPLHSESARVITAVGAAKTGPRDTTKPNLLRTCRAVNEEAMDILYSHTKFKLASTKTIYLFLRSIGKAGRRLIKTVDVQCGGREDAIAFALLACCEKLRAITLRIPRPMLIIPGAAPIWLIDGVSCLLALSGLEEVAFGGGKPSLNWMNDEQPDAAIVKRELTRPKGTSGDIRSVIG